MNKVLTSVCGGAALVAFLTGCDPQLAQVRSGSQEEEWYRHLKENYRSFEAPQNPAPAVYNGNAGAANSARTAAVQPVDDPEKAVDRAADGENMSVIPVRDEKKAEKENAPTEKDVKEAPEKAEKAEKDAPAPQEKKEENAAPAKADSSKEATPLPPESDNTGKLYVVKPGDTLGGIAQKFYGKASMEDVIFRANSKKLKNRNSLSIGMSLVIPEL